MVWLLWVANILFASLLYFPFSGFLNDVLSHRAAAKDFLKTFDMNTFFEIITHHGEKINTIISFAFFLLLGYVIASVFINGGILFTLAQTKKSGEKNRVASLFFMGGAKFFWRFLRLLIYSLILWLGAMTIFFLFHMILNPFTAGGTNEALLFYLVWVRLAIAIFLVFLIKMIMDYARINIVTEDTRNVFTSVFQAAGFVFRRWGSTLAIYYLFVLTGAAIFMVYWLVQKIVKTHALLPILIAFLIGQIFILSRGWLKVALQAAQLGYYQSVRTAPNIRDSASLPAEKNARNLAT
jgi:hypothetical protein